MALRLVVLVDRLYDRDIPVAVSGERVDAIFSPEMRAGGYRQKYGRALSRLVFLSRAVPGGAAADDRDAAQAGSSTRSRAATE